ncbi:ribosome maturation factor RimM [Parvularcula lutaonensis]|uniref:Ribosome maturation factor RimM n=1 Tax=Parvularcula lutaonensis TaxID=491923 RepID=A0ABV7M930_9PROT|nr:ribosome maturation factor RimM [Parvularcula lutaonensis]
MVAQFAGPHGVRGEFKLRSYTEEPRDVFTYGPLTSPNGAVLRPSFVRELKPGVFLCRDKGISSPEQTAPFKGALLSVPRSVLPEAEDEDDFYVADLIGLEARSEDGTVLGKVRAVPNHGAGDIVEVKCKGGFVLVPFTKEAVPEVNIDGGYIVIVPPEDDPDAPRGEDA